jgi:hypothetical protein
MNFLVVISKCPSRACCKNTFAQNVKKAIGILFVGEMSCRIAVPGIVKYAGSAEIGVSGTVRSATNALMV